MYSGVPGAKWAKASFAYGVAVPAFVSPQAESRTYKRTLPAENAYHSLP